MGWKELQAVRYRTDLINELTTTSILKRHVLVLTIRPAEKLDLQFAGVKRDRPLPPGSVVVMPAGSSVLWRQQGRIDLLFIYLEPSILARVAADSFGDPNRASVPPFYCLSAPELCSTMLTVDAELRAHSSAGPLLAESLAAVLCVNLIRCISSTHEVPAPAEGVVSPRKLHKVFEYILENLESSLTLEQMAAVADLDPYSFARKFKAATGLPPHQYVIARRVERARRLLRAGHDLDLAEVAHHSGFSSQSKLSFYFKRIVGVTPRQFRTSAAVV